MSKAEKQLARLLSLPKNFTWEELVSVMLKHNFELHTGSGSARKFIHPKTEVVCSMHEPHPIKVVKTYALKLAISSLKEAGEI